MRTSQIANKSRTFRSGPYLDSLFRAAERMDERLQAEICARIKRSRIEAGFTQQEAADLLGMTLRGYQNYESDRVPFRKLGRIAELFGVTEPWLLRGGASTEDVATVADIVRRLAALEAMVEVQGAATTSSVDALARDVRGLAQRLPRRGGRATEATG